METKLTTTEHPRGGTIEICPPGSDSWYTIFFRDTGEIQISAYGGKTLCVFPSQNNQIELKLL